MSSNAGLLMSVLGSFIGDTSPKRNPNHNGIDSLDPQTGTWKPGEEPYIQPNFGTKLFHPDVAAQEGANNSAMYNAWLANQARNKINEGNIDIGRTGYGKDVTDMTTPELNQLSGGESSNIPAVQARSLQQKFGVSELSARDIAAGLKESTAGHNAALQFGLPEAEAAARTSRSNFETPYFSGQTGMIEPRLSLERAQIGSSLNTLPSETSRRIAENTAGQQIAERETQNKDALDALRTTGLGTQLSLASQEQQNLPYLNQAARNRAIAESWQSRFLGPAPYRSPAIDDSGNIIPAVRRPDFVSPLSNIEGLQDATKAGVGGVRLPGGAALPMISRPTSYSPLTGKAIDVPATVTPIRPVSPDIHIIPKEKPSVDYDTFMDKLNSAKDKSKGSPRTSLKYIADHLAEKYRTNAGEKVGSSIFNAGPTPSSNVYWDAMTGNSKVMNHNGIVELMKQLPPEVLQQALEEGGIK